MNKFTHKSLGSSGSKLIRLGRFKKLRVGAMSFASISVVLFVAVGLFYFVVINVVSTKGAKLHTLELQKKSLVSENERLAVEAARLQSLAVIEKGANAKIEIGEDGQPTGVVKFEDDEPKVDEVTYIPRMVPISGMSYLEEFGAVAISE